jgi:N-hydroxyarylamine O-acetyltransferase
MDTGSYLERIKYEGSLEPTAETLRALQVAHMRAVPFENLSIHKGEPIILNDEALFQKIVARRRGGFCYELNGLFAALLRALGFSVQMLSAGVARPDGSFSPDFDHMTLLVTLEDRWLVDVGFGDSFLEPLLLDFRGEQIQGQRAYEIVPSGSHFILRQRDCDSDWKDQYRFTLQPYQFPDYEEMCRFHQTSPESHFTRNRICSLATPTGRITLSGLRRIVTTADQREERDIANEEEYSQLLRDEFGIH